MQQWKCLRGMLFPSCSQKLHTSVNLYEYTLSSFEFQIFILKEMFFPRGTFFVSVVSFCNTSESESSSAMFMYKCHILNADVITVPSNFCSLVLVSVVAVLHAADSHCAQRQQRP